MNPFAILTLLKQHRKVATVVVCAAVAGAFYIQWQTAALDASRAEAQRTALIGSGDTICAALGAEFRPAEVKPAAWGHACLAEARRLGRIEGELAEGSVDALLKGLDDRMGREAADALVAAAFAKRAALAAERMETADAAVQDDVATGSWSGAVNNAAGLRDGR